MQEELRLMSGGDVDAERVAVDDLVKYAASKGHTFSAEEIGSAFELSDDELDAVAGGAAFAKYDGIDGEARDKDHKNWITLDSISSAAFRRF
jgi:hypothetical protein